MCLVAIATTHSSDFKHRFNHFHNINYLSPDVDPDIMWIFDYIEPYHKYNKIIKMDILCSHNSSGIGIMWCTRKFEIFVLSSLIDFSLSSSSSAINKYMIFNYNELLSELFTSS